MKKNSLDKKCRHKTIVTNIDFDMAEQLEAISKESGLTRALLVRRAIKNFMEDGVNDGIKVMNQVLLSQKLQELKDQISEEDYAYLLQLVDNHFKLEG